MDDFPRVHWAPGSAENFDGRREDRAVLEPGVWLAALYLPNFDARFQQSYDALEVPDIDAYAWALSVAGAC